MKNFTPADLQAALNANPDLGLIGGPVEAPPRQMHGPSEHDLQVAIMAECETLALVDPRYSLLFAIPNGGQRHPAVAAKLRAEGVRPGVPDLCLPVASRGYHGCWLELKVGRNRPTVHQIAWCDALREQGHFVATVYDDAAVVLDIIAWYLDK
jgi:hypothetical protein